MQETTFLILTALADGPQHGYGIIRDVGRISGGRVTLRAGTLYGALERLDADGLIRVDREEVVDRRLRRYYRWRMRKVACGLAAGLPDQAYHQRERWPDFASRWEPRPAVQPGTPRPAQAHRRRPNAAAP
jgi:PadR family transcriptional regulator